MVSQSFFVSPLLLLFSRFRGPRKLGDDQGGWWHVLEEKDQKWLVFGSLFFDPEQEERQREGDIWEGMVGKILRSWPRAPTLPPDPLLYADADFAWGHSLNKRMMEERKLRDNLTQCFSKYKTNYWRHRNEYNNLQMQQKCHFEKTTWCQLWRIFPSFSFCLECSSPRPFWVLPSLIFQVLAQKPQRDLPWPPTLSSAARTHPYTPFCISWPWLIYLLALLTTWNLIIQWVTLLATSFSPTLRESNTMKTVTGLFHLKVPPPGPMIMCVLNINLSPSITLQPFDYIRVHLPSCTPFS